MLNKIKESLLILDEQLDILWRNYLTNRPHDWLYHPDRIDAQFGEMQGLWGAVRHMRVHVQDVRDVLNDSPHLDLLRKEN